MVEKTQAELARKSRENNKFSTKEIINKKVNTKAKPTDSKNKLKGMNHFFKTYQKQFKIGGIVAILTTSMGLGVGLSGHYYAQIMFIADGGSKNDHSFNQQGWDATKNFGKSHKNKHGFKYSGLDDNTTSKNELMNVYKNFYSYIGEITILSGFKHDAHDFDSGISGAWTAYTNQNKDAKSIFIDNGEFAVTKYTVTEKGESDASDFLPKEGEEVIPKGNKDYKNKLAYHLDQENIELDIKDVLDEKNVDYKNTLGLTFASEEGSFQAGIASWMHAFMDENGNQRNQTLRNVSGFTGMSFATTIDFMSGYEHAIEIMNQLLVDDIETTGIVSSREDSRSASDTDNKAVQFVSPQTKGGKTNDGTMEGKDWATGSFDLEEPNAVAFAQNAKNKNVQAFLPVAGPQAAPVLDVIDKDDTMKVIGVDTDLTKNELGKYSQDKILTSVLKNIEFSTRELLTIWGASEGKFEDPLKVYESLPEQSIPNKLINDEKGNTRDLEESDLTLENAKIFATERNLENGGVGVPKEGHSAEGIAKLYENFKKLYTSNSSNDLKVAYNTIDTILTDTNSTFEEFVAEVVILATGSENEATAIADIDGAINSSSKTFS